MVDLGEEADLGGSHGIVVWQEQLKLEDTTCLPRLSVGCEAPPDTLKVELTLVWRLRGAINSNVEIAQVVVVRSRRDALDPAAVRDWLLLGLELKKYLRLVHQTLRLLNDTLWEGHG